MALADSLTSDGLCTWLTVKHALMVRDAHRSQVVQRSVCLGHLLYALLKSVFGPSPRHPPLAYFTPIHVGAPTEPSTSFPDVVLSPCIPM